MSQTNLVSHVWSRQIVVFFENCDENCDVAGTHFNLAIQQPMQGGHDCIVVQYCTVSGELLRGEARPSLATRERYAIAAGCELQVRLLPRKAV